MEAAVVNTLSAGRHGRWCCARASSASAGRRSAAPTASTVDPARGALRRDRPRRALRRGAARAPRDQGGADAAQRVLDRRAPRREGHRRRRRAPPAAILVVDAVSSLGIADLPMDAWGVDVVVSGSQKGLMLPPGLVLLRALREGVGPRQDLAAAEVLLRPRRRAEDRRAGTRRTSRPPCPSCVGLREVLRMLEAEGLANVFKRHERLARATRVGRARRSGLELFAKAHAEPGAHRGGGAARRRQRADRSRPTRPRTTSRSPAGRGR